MHVALRNKLNITGSTDFLDPKTQLETEKAVSGDLLARAPSSGSGQCGSSAHLAFSTKMASWPVLEERHTAQLSYTIRFSSQKQILWEKTANTRAQTKLNKCF